jgi:hypothetical protein
VTQDVIDNAGIESKKEVDEFTEKEQQLIDQGY